MDKIAEDIYKITVPLPKNPLKALNSYLIRGNRNLLIDTGFNRPECEERIKHALDALHISMDITDIFVTHLHSDHCGLISRLATGGTKVYCSEVDGKLINRAAADAYWEELARLFAAHGFPSEEGGKAEFHPGRKYRNEGEIKFSYVKDGDYLKAGSYLLECIATPGHTNGHMCLLDSRKKLLFSGDHILDDITPNICIELGNVNPLEKYIESLNKIGNLEVETVLTGHRTAPVSIKKRIREICFHHIARLEEMMRILRGRSMSAYEVAQEMTWKIDCDCWDDFPVPQKWFATGEAAAHLEYLEYERKVRRTIVEGKYVFSVINQSETPPL